MRVASVRQVFDEARNVFRKIRRIVRFPSYDNNLIDGDLALLQLSGPVPLSGAATNLGCK